jgi:hypothetical protein
MGAMNGTLVNVQISAIQEVQRVSGDRWTAYGFSADDDIIELQIRRSGIERAKEAQGGGILTGTARNSGATPYLEIR